jgi:hypothetical protein
MLSLEGREEYKETRSYLLRVWYKLCLKTIRLEREGSQPRIHGYLGATVPPCYWAAEVQRSRGSCGQRGGRSFMKVAKLSSEEPTGLLERGGSSQPEPSHELLGWNHVTITECLTMSLNLTLITSSIHWVVCSTKPTVFSVSRVL